MSPTTPEESSETTEVVPDANLQPVLDKVASGGWEMVEMSESTTWKDFGIGLATCSECTQRCLNRGCEETDTRICEDCWPKYATRRWWKQGGAAYMKGLQSIRVILVRHGESRSNALGMLEKGVAMLHDDLWDPALTEKGRMQVSRLGEDLRRYLSTRNLQVDLVAVSSLFRTIETACGAVMGDGQGNYTSLANFPWRNGAPRVKVWSSLTEHGSLQGNRALFNKQEVRDKLNGVSMLVPTDSEDWQLSEKNIAECAKHPENVDKARKHAAAVQTFQEAIQNKVCHESKEFAKGDMHKGSLFRGPGFLEVSAEVMSVLRLQDIIREGSLLRSSDADGPVLVLSSHSDANLQFFKHMFEVLGNDESLLRSEIPGPGPACGFTTAGALAEERMPNAAAVAFKLSVSASGKLHVDGFEWVSSQECTGTPTAQCSDGSKLHASSLISAQEATSHRNGSADGDQLDSLSHGIAWLAMENAFLRWEEEGSEEQRAYENKHASGFLVI
eukprot:TRINITY_DN17000_c0_g1_i1.p1 TRINITY_DN17000_c0_g1~~TRINITY_DN17000_c0_g1_i1.p1  ORF type:complete len:501 (+),score=81.58 TRINITY_DN17000_c0_g1_i1:99-1601(+)